MFILFQRCFNVCSQSHYFTILESEFRKRDGTLWPSGFWYVKKVKVDVIKLIGAFATNIGRRVNLAKRKFHWFFYSFQTKLMLQSKFGLRSNLVCEILRKSSLSNFETPQKFCISVISTYLLFLLVRTSQPEHRKIQGYLPHLIPRSWSKDNGVKGGFQATNQDVDTKKLLNPKGICVYRHRNLLCSHKIW